MLRKKETINFNTFLAKATLRNSLIDFHVHKEKKNSLRFFTMQKKNFKWSLRIVACMKLITRTGRIEGEKTGKISALLMKHKTKILIMLYKLAIGRKFPVQVKLILWIITNILPILTFNRSANFVSLNSCNLEVQWR